MHIFFNVNYCLNRTNQHQLNTTVQLGSKTNHRTLCFIVCVFSSVAAKKVSMSSKKDAAIKKQHE